VKLVVYRLKGRDFSLWKHHIDIHLRMVDNLLHYEQGWDISCMKNPIFLNTNNTCFNNTRIIRKDIDMLMSILLSFN
jgi:hypothetical protein